MKWVVASLVESLLEDESWQGAFTDDERAIWIRAAGAQLRYAARHGKNLSIEYRRVRAMLKAGAENFDQSLTAP